jgi:DME family drug/metabolite transporter
VPGLPWMGRGRILMPPTANPSTDNDLATARDRLGVLAAGILFSTGGAAIKATELTSWQVASFRSGVAALAVLLLLKEARKGWSWHVLPVSVAYATTMILFVAANKLTTSASAIFLQDTAPLYVLLASPFLLKEKITRRDLVFMGVMALAMTLFFVERPPAAATAPNPLLGNALALISSVSWAATVMGLRWLSSRAGGEGNSLPTVVAGNLIACLVCLPLALPAQVSAPDAALIGYLGLFQIALAYVLLVKGIRGVPALEASVLLLVEPALNPFWTFIVHGENPGGWALLGGFLILGATLVKTLLDRRASVAAEAPMG